MALYLGIDGGGTYTRSVIVRETGEVVGEAKVGSTNRNHFSEEVVTANFRVAVVDACGALDPRELKGAFLGMCGASNAADFDHLKAMFLAAPELPVGIPVTVVNDTYSGLSGGLSGRPGIVLIAGTGSAVFGRNSAGETYLCGGWGALVDDSGSAYWVGLEALKIAARVADGRAKPTLLKDIVFKFLGITDARQIISRVHNEGLERSDLAFLAPDVIKAYTAGDWAAIAIVTRAIDELVACVKTVADKLFTDGSECGVIFVGGLALSGEPFQRLLTEAIEKTVPNSKVYDAEMPPDRGAALEALRAAGIELTPAVLNNLKTTKAG